MERPAETRTRATLPKRLDGTAHDRTKRFCYLREPCVWLDCLLLETVSLRILPLELLDFLAVRKRLADFALLILGRLRAGDIDGIDDTEGS
jgi:hypothetical protein